MVHERDLAESWGRVLMPDALDRKYPNAPKGGNHIRSGLSAFVPLTHWNNVCCRKDETACYLEAKPEYGFIWKPYKQ